MKPVERFAEYNKENILGNFLQAETHLKNLGDDYDPEWAACIHKHLLEAQAELSELIAHEPEGGDDYREMMARTRKLRKASIRGMPVGEAISELRSIRGDFEKHVRGHDTEKCESCGPVDDILKKLGTKHLNTGTDQELNIDSNHGGNMPKEKNLVLNALAGNFVGKGVSVATPMVVTGSTAGIANKTIANVGIGAVLSGLALYGKLKKANYLGAVAGTNLIANEVVDLLMGYLPVNGTPPATVMAPAAVASAGARVNSQATLQKYPYGTVGGSGASSQTYSNGSLVYID
jgi:hypothetical protein